MMLDYICEECQSAFSDLKTDLDAMGIDYLVDPGIVRGLDYYTKTAFEIVSKNIGAQGTVCGGGRYDNLIEQVGGPATPGVGFGMGIERLLLVMDHGNIAIPRDDDVDVFLAVMGDQAQAFGLDLTRQLRKNGFRAQMDLKARTIKNQFKYADRLNANYTIIIGDNELASQMVIIKDMKTSEQKQIEVGDIMKTLKELKSGV